MGRFKVVDYSPRFLPVDLSCQLIPGTFEFALHHLLEHELDLSEIQSRYGNDEVGASAYDLALTAPALISRFAIIDSHFSSLPAVQAYRPSQRRGC